MNKQWAIDILERMENECRERNRLWASISWDAIEEIKATTDSSRYQIAKEVLLEWSKEWVKNPFQANQFPEWIEEKIANNL